MKKIALLLTLCILSFSCSKDKDDDLIQDVNVKLSVGHSWDNTPIDNTTGKVNFTTQKGQIINIERFRYLLSNIELVNSNGLAYTLSDYNLFDLSDASSYQLPAVNIPTGIYTLRFVYGFNEADNISSKYPDLNTASWNWPAALGGGYHFMQFDGKYDVTTSPKPFNYHNGTAKKGDGTFEQNFVEFDFPQPIVVKSNLDLNLNMNIAELFKNTYQWDLDVYNTVLMPNYDAQKKMNQNIPTVFTIGK